jgi:hypothetical protein
VDFNEQCCVRWLIIDVNITAVGQEMDVYFYARYSDIFMARDTSTATVTMKMTTA